MRFLTARGSAARGEVRGGEREKAMGEVRQEVKHRMGRRCFGWDYSGRCIYMVTITLADRSRPVLGRLVGGGEAWRVVPSGIGRIVEECWREIPQQWPGVEVRECQVMPDHFHGIVFVKERQGKTLGNIVGSFKSKSTRRAREWSAAHGEAPCGNGSGATARAPGLWAAGYVDLILFRRGQLEKMRGYILDNPRRRGVRMEHPELFRVVRNLEVGFARAREDSGEGGIPPWKGAETGCFEAVGNHFLLDWPVICQVQCSRSFFAYKRERLPGGWRICRDAVGRPVVGKRRPSSRKRLPRPCGRPRTGPCCSVPASATASVKSRAGLSRRGIG